MRRILNPPNLITLVRAGMVPWIATSILGQAHGQALWLLMVAGSTDALDGFLARRFGWSSRLGAILDPLADKALLVTVYLAMGAAGMIPAWLVWIVVGRDLLILLFAGAAFLRTQQRRFDPSMWGKLSTLVQIVAAVGILASRAFHSPTLSLWAEPLPAIAAATTVWSGLHYAWRSAPRLKPTSN
jgi:cardiolipin synthase